ncbi:hypothetical protein GG681_17405 [Epibacterium sp. SM1969]|uniref:Uncharacterized protein n=1 Tax=Tritonibacter aquimaris TaxID=2663379 RepID=A0A844ATE8_9RHOB|nr:hypothetical protein [Tritonibacter aquimaris]MQY44423.1 hypothetical protein [Tritonibacter aquimaris]
MAEVAEKVTRDVNAGDLALLSPELIESCFFWAGFAAASVWEGNNRAALWDLLVVGQSAAGFFIVFHEKSFRLA